MTDYLLILLCLIAVAQLGAIVYLIVRRASPAGGSDAVALQLASSLEKADRAMRDEFARSRDELSSQSARNREEAGKSAIELAASLRGEMNLVATLQKDNLATFAQQLSTLVHTLSAQSDGLKLQVTQSLKDLSASLVEQLRANFTFQKDQLDSFARQVNHMATGNETRMETLRQAMDEKLQGIQADNATKLEQIRLTVDEKLHATLEQRFGESFKLVSDRLEQVHKGLGEMQTLALGVGDLKRVLNNVKTRGTWGEMKLHTLLEELLTPDQYCCNIKTNPNSSDLVEFAIKLPGRDGLNGKVVYLPIDAKFPKEDIERLLEAQEQADPELVEIAGKALELRIKSEAQSIHEKYICPPHTTDFAILFLATESLYAEVLRRPGLAEALQRQFRVNVTGPSTFAALLNSLQMGFRTLAIEQRSSEVWQTLAAVKTEFGKFGDVMDKVQKKLSEASNTIDTVATRSRAIQRKLKSVEALPSTEAEQLLGQLALEEEEAESS